MQKRESIADKSAIWDGAKMKLPRIMIGATASGTGKTLITCGILQAFVNRKLKTASFKGGPDYIDPMFHSKIIGAKSRNLDTFFTNDETTKYLFGKTAKNADISVMEGVMGFYDGMSLTSTQASSYELAKITDTPVILIVNCHGMSLSILPMIKGFIEYRADSHIEGVILNQVSKCLYTSVKQQIETELQIKVFGYVPIVKDLMIESRHLGLITPDEVDGLHSKLDKLAELFEETINLDEILDLARNTSELSYQAPIIPKLTGKTRIAVAKDEAFCFYYEDNLELLKEMGAQLIEFSPLHQNSLPKDIDGLLLGGGYPELFAEVLSENTSMRQSLKIAIEQGLPCMAECGGFMYLHHFMEDMNGNKYPMVGIIDGEVYRTNKLNRFGYITLTANKNQMITHNGGTIKGHEFHYFESTNCGDSFTAQKPSRKLQWNCIHGNQKLAAGFPHLYYYSNMDIPFQFLTVASVK